jgi:hypothetical protein
MNRQERRAQGKGSDSAINVTPAEGRERRMALIEKHYTRILEVFVEASKHEHGHTGIVCLLDSDDVIGRKLLDAGGRKLRGLQVCVIARNDLIEKFADSLPPEVSEGLPDCTPGALHILCVSAWGASLFTPTVKVQIDPALGQA